MPFEGVQPAAPQLPVGREPPVHLRKPLGPQPVQAALPVRPNAHQPGVAQHAQVLRYPGLGEAEPADELAHGPLTLPKEVENAPALRLGEDVEGGVHGG
jgi:hypothetical protein